VVGPKIVVIGAGSASFGPNTLATIARTPELRGSTLCLVDLDGSALRAVAALAQRLSDEWDAALRVHAALDRVSVLQGADFVILSIEVPPREVLWRQDWSLTLAHGLRQPYGENGGPGGLIHTFRQIPPLLAIAGDMEKLCPEAWLINFSNPLTRLTRAVTKYSGIKTVGKCHQLTVGYSIAAVLLDERYGFGLPGDIDLHSDPDNAPRTRSIATIARRDISITAAGLNHFTWMLDVQDRRTGQDLYPELRQAAQSPPPTLEPLSLELLRIFGYCPVPGDSHLCEYLPWLHDPVARPWERYNLRLYNWDRNEAKRKADMVAMRQMISGKLAVDSLHDVYSEGAAEIIAAIVTGHEFYDEAINIPNQGSVAGLPEETIVECPAIIDGTGIRPTGTHRLAPPIAELCRREAALVELVVDAGVQGDPELALHALLLDPMMNDIDRARQVLDDYLDVMAGYLPQFDNRRAKHVAPPSQ
jgi:alpha-galactosidase